MRGRAFHGGIFASADGGRTWEPRDKGLTENDVFTLAARHIDGQVRLFAGTEPAHLFCSDDLGESWREIPSLRSVPSFSDSTYPGPPHIAHVKHVNFAPNDPRILHVSVEQGALLRNLQSTNKRSEFPASSSTSASRDGRWRPGAS